MTAQSPASLLGKGTLQIRIYQLCRNNTAVLFGPPSVAQLSAYKFYIFPRIMYHNILKFYCWTLFGSKLQSMP